MRPTTESTTSAYRYLQHDNLGNPFQSFHTYPSFERTYTGVRTPGYLARKKAGTLPINPYNSNVVRIGREGWVSYAVVDAPMHQRVDTSPVHFANGSPLGAGFPSLVADTQNKAVRSLYSKVEGVKVNYAQFLGERKQVVELFASTATRVVNAARALRHGDLRTFQQSLSLAGSNLGDRELLATAWKRAMRTPVKNRLANHWLEFYFGWKPLLKDVYESAELLAESITRSQKPEGVISVSKSTRQRLKQHSGGSGNRIVVDFDDVHTCRVNIRVHYRLEDEARNLLNKTGISNPLLLAWELIPFSFVVDWFLPVGNYLESLMALDGFVLTEGSLSTLESAVSHRTVGYRNVEPAYQITNFSGPCAVLATQSRFSRVPTVSFPYALRLKSPIPTEPRDRFLTAVALLTQLFGRGSASNPAPKPTRFG